MKDYKKNIRGALQNFFSALSVMLTIALAGSISMVASGQEAPESAATNRVLSEITVTARRTEERLEDVPVAVSAFNNAAIEERKILTEYDLAVATPGMLLRQGMASNYVSYTLRGQSVGSFSYSPPSVVTYFNEVPVGGLSQTSFFDLESIQVLKGPQGTLFGRNTTGGAVLYSAKRPDDDINGYIKFVAGVLGTINRSLFKIKETDKTRIKNQ
ncbi:TonB-dependent receptor plug domain-containing protein [Porticoccaceae bacterium]|nr:TonB-dependent receptor plug domain-containing protein [Porticoccaceae bacterium]